MQRQVGFGRILIAANATANVAADSAWPQVSAQRNNNNNKNVFLSLAHARALSLSPIHLATDATRRTSECARRERHCQQVVFARRPLANKRQRVDLRSMSLHAMQQRRHKQRQRASVLRVGENATETRREARRARARLSLNWMIDVVEPIGDQRRRRTGRHGESQRVVAGRRRRRRQRERRRQVARLCRAQRQRRNRLQVALAASTRRVRIKMRQRERRIYAPTDR